MNGLWVAEPVSVPLRDDLQAGRHEVAIRLRGLPAPAFARFFLMRLKGPEEP
jgi:hypothetical protein